MFKGKRKFLFLLLVILLGGIILQNTTEKKELVGEHELARVIQVKDEKIQKYCKAEFIKEHYGSSDQIQTNFVGRTISVSNVPESVKVIAEMSYGEVDNGVEKTKKFQSDAYIPSDGTISIVIPETYQGRSVYTTNGSVTLYFYPIQKYEDDTHLCDTTDILFYKQPSKANERLDNPSYDATYCVDYRNQYSGVLEMRQAVSYCFESSVDAVYDEEVVKSWIKTAEETYQFRQQALLNSQKEFSQVEGEKEISNPSQEIQLTCDAFSTDVIEKDGTISHYANEKTYSHTETKSAPNGYCQTSCKETVTVKYQAPVAVQAGLCFSYQVEIASKVECRAESTGKYPQKKPVCVPTADCNGTYDWHHDQGGPEDDFDRCVLDCDGGKYSQKCINSCYQKVYQNKSQEKQKLSYQSPINRNQAVLMANVTCPPDSSDTTPTYRNASKIWTAAEVYAFRQEHPGGKYKSLGGGKWEWVPGGDCPSQVGYYYFSTPQLTASTLSGFRSIYASWGNGFKMEDSSRFHCDSTCEWIGNCPSDSKQTPMEAAKDYEKQLAEEKADWDYCNEQLVCDTTTTVYTVTVNKDDQDHVNYEVYEASQKPGQEPSGDGIIKDYSGRCYSIEDGWEYRNVITFPEVWQANKNHLLTTKKPDDIENYTAKGNVFCTSQRTPPVNLAWYNWRVYRGGTEESVTEELKSAVAKERKDNINVHIGSGNNNKENDHLWGLMGWNFDINCFYAAANPAYCDDQKCDYPEYCKDGVCPNEIPSKDTPIANYSFRAVSLDDMFPEREARWNWSCNASNTNNENYPVQPSTITEEIEKKGNSIYQDEAELDYDIVLKQSTMKKIREYNKSKKSYTDFDLAGLKDDEKVEGITVYKSKLLNDLGTGVIQKRGMLGCNNQTGNSCNNTIVKDQCYTAFNLGG